MDSSEANLLVFRQRMFGPRRTFRSKTGPSTCEFRLDSYGSQRHRGVAGGSRLQQGRQLKCVGGRVAAPEVEPRLDPVGVNLGAQRILRTSSLTPRTGHLLGSELSGIEQEKEVSLHAILMRNDANLPLIFYF